MPLLKFLDGTLCIVEQGLEILSSTIQDSHKGDSCSILGNDLDICSSFNEQL